MELIDDLKKQIKNLRKEKQEQQGAIIDVCVSHLMKDFNVRSRPVLTSFKEVETITTLRDTKVDIKKEEKEERFIILNGKPDTRYDYNLGYINGRGGEFTGINEQGKLVRYDAEYDYKTETHNIEGGIQVIHTRELICKIKTYSGSQILGQTSYGENKWTFTYNNFISRCLGLTNYAEKVRRLQEEIMKLQYDNEILANTLNALKNCEIQRK